MILRRLLTTRELWLIPEIKMENDILKNYYYYNHQEKSKSLKDLTPEDGKYSIFVTSLNHMCL